jgi:hypothetical protein
LPPTLPASFHLTIFFSSKKVHIPIFKQLDKMTSRGRKPSPVPLPPRDPTLESCPVPWERHYPVQAFGPGATPEAQLKFQSLEELNQHPTSTAGNAYTDNDGKYFFEALTSESTMDWREDDSDTGEQTWGPTIILTAYSEKASQKVDCAIENLVEIIHRYFVRRPRSKAFAMEAFNRLKLDLIKDKDFLENASDDQVREEFDAHFRSLRLFPADSLWEKECPDNLNRPRGPRRYDFCTVLDEETIDFLSEITFPENLNKDRDILKGISIKLVDKKWTYPEDARDEGGLGSQLTMIYSGTDMCPILDQPWICAKIYEHAGLEEIFPLDCYRDTW